MQACLNVLITFLCTGATFVVVRSCWLTAAYRLTRYQSVPSYSLLSLNTIGETIDVLWLLRCELFTRRYRILLIQCIFVALLTVATLFSGLIARFSTQDGEMFKATVLNGNIAKRSTPRILYEDANVNATLQSLKDAEVPPTTLLEFLPSQGTKWHYRAEQWNSSWSMQCMFNTSVEIVNPMTLDNCSEGVKSQFPQLADTYRDWTENSKWDFYQKGWSISLSRWQDVMLLSHGIHWKEYDSAFDLHTALEMRTAIIYLHGVPRNDSLSGTGCDYGIGRIDRASYSSCSCELTRQIDGHSKNELFWGAYPDATDVKTVAKTYFGFYGDNRFMVETAHNRTVSEVAGEELVLFYQAYQITKDVTNSAVVFRDIDTFVRVPQISLTCVILCCIVLLIDVSGVACYWFFIFRHGSNSYETPQSKLDWMLQSLKTNDKRYTRYQLKQKLGQSVTSRNKHNDVTSSVVSLVAFRSDNGESRRKKPKVEVVISSTESSGHKHRGSNNSTRILNFTRLERVGSTIWPLPKYERIDL